MKTYTREEIKAITPEQLNAMSAEERNNVIKQGRQFLYEELGPDA